MATETDQEIISRSQELIYEYPIIELFKIDMSLHGGGTAYLTQSGTDITYQSHFYTPISIMIEGLETDNGSSLPRPTLTISNVNKSLLAEVIEYNGLRGCTVTYIKTFEDLIDSGISWPEMKFKILSKNSHDKKEIKFTLSIPLDCPFNKYPDGIICGICRNTYRKWNGSSFDYGTCPYTGSNYYTKEDVATTAANDVCGKRLSSCQLRYGTAEELPFNGFPGTGTYN